MVVVYLYLLSFCYFFFFKQKTAYEMRISDWSSDVCSSDLGTRRGKTELSTVDTSLLLGGVLFAQSYYDADTPVEAEIRDLAEKIYGRVDWTFVQRENSNIPSANGGGQKAIAMGWYPERGDGGGFGRHAGASGSASWR